MPIMYSLQRAVVVSAMLALANGQNIISAQGTKGSNISTGLQVDLTDPNDMNIIKVSEISSNIVNQCGRTVNGGNIDVGAKTEAALAVGNVTQVTKGSDVTVTMSANSTLASGTYTCDLDPQGNVQGATGQTKLTSSSSTKSAKASNGKGTTKNNARKLMVRQSIVARANKATGGTMTLTVTMPSDLACIGASAGNVCTVRCINAQEVGGCFAVQQTDTTPLDGNNSPSNITTSQASDAITKQIAQNKQDLTAAENAIAASPFDALTNEGKQNAAVVAAIMSADPATSSSTAKAATNSTSSTSGKKNKGNAAKAQGATAKKAGKINNKRDSASSKWAKRRSISVSDEE